jgi:hypothetical protein
MGFVEITGLRSVRAETESGDCLKTRAEGILRSRDVSPPDRMYYRRDLSVLADQISNHQNEGRDECGLKGTPWTPA